MRVNDASSDVGADTANALGPRVIVECVIQDLGA